MKNLLSILTATVLIFTGYMSKAQGCAEPTSEEGVQLFGYFQPEFNTYFEDDTRASTEFRRMRIGVMGNVPYDFGYYVLTEWSNFQNPNESGGPFLLDAFVSYNRYPFAKVAVGSFKYPFGLELSTACHGLYTIRRSKIVGELTANYDATSNRDIGVMVLGGNDTTRFTYRVALTNGYGIFSQENDLTRSYSLTGRVTFRPINNLVLGASYRDGILPNQDEAITQSDTKMRYGFDAFWKQGSYFLQGEYISGEDVGSYTTGGGCDGGPGETVIGAQDRVGYFLMGGYRFANNLEPVYKFESYKSTTSSGQEGTTAAVVESFCQTFGVNYYPNDWTRIQVNYVYSAEDPEEIKNDALLVQLQVRF